MRSAKVTNKNRNKQQIKSKVKSDEDQSVSKARTVIRPSVQAALTLQEYGKGFGELDLPGLVESLTEQIQCANEGDLRRPEAMLTAQAHSLDAIFNNLARRAAINMGEYVQACETYLKLALRAQSQCRATLEALSEMKQPRSVAFVSHANIAHGHQQVNNAPSRTDEMKENTQSKQLEEKDGERLDAGTKGTAGGADTSLETVGAVHRAKNKSG